MRALALGLLGLSLSGCTAIAGLGAIAVGVGATALFLGCDDAVGVEIWDRATAHTICDATVVAEFDGSVVPFSPCYRTYLGEGTWKVTATKAGYVPAVGQVVVTKTKHCDSVFHSVTLTLVPEGMGAAAPVQVNAPAASSPAAPPVVAAPPSTAPGDAPAPAPAPAATPPPSTTNRPPTSAFPPAPPAAP